MAWGVCCKLARKQHVLWMYPAEGRERCMGQRLMESMTSGDRGEQRLGRGVLRGVIGFC